MSSNLESRAAQSADQRHDSQSLVGLFNRLLNDASALARNELKLAKTEFQEAIFNLKVGLTAVAVAVAVLIAGLLALVAAAVIALAQAVAWWLSALIVGIALSVLGAALFVSARRKLLDPQTQLDHSRDALDKDVTVVARKTS